MLPQLPMLPLISIVVPNYNGNKFLRECLTSLVEQDYPSLEIIVMDGGSSDGSIETIKDFSHKISYWESAKDDGPASAISKGFLRASGLWLGWLNSDDIMLPGAIQSLAIQINLNKQVEWIVGNRILINEQGYFVRMQSGLQSPEAIVARDALGIPQEATFFARKLYTRAGAIDTKLACHFDLDLFLRFYSLSRPAFSESVFGCFRQRYGQISQNITLSQNDYIDKIDPFYSRLNVKSRVVLRLSRTRFRSLLRFFLKAFCGRLFCSNSKSLVYFSYDFKRNKWFMQNGISLLS
jgi:glycosyltransferase involved in cell wall biosynthesis